MSDLIWKSRAAGHWRCTHGPNEDTGNIERGWCGEPALWWRGGLLDGDKDCLGRCNAHHPGISLPGAGVL